MRKLDGMKLKISRNSTLANLVTHVREKLSTNEKGQAMVNADALGSDDNLDNTDSNGYQDFIHDTIVELPSISVPNGKTYLSMLRTNPVPEADKAVSIRLQISESLSMEVVGYMVATFLPRPHNSFFADAYKTSEELRSLACIFCEPNGAFRLKHPELQADTTTSCPPSQGGFICISSLEVEPSHQGLDLGLKIVESLLDHFKGRWSLAVMGVTVPQHHRWKPREENKKYATIKLIRHMMRIGFTQAGNNWSLWNRMFLTPHLYESRADTSAKATSLQVYSPPKKVVLELMNLELQDLVSSFCRLNHSSGFAVVEPRWIKQLEGLILCGASIDGALALHWAAKNGGGGPLIHQLVKQGGGVNQPDQHGMCPLHLAAWSWDTSAVKALLAAGADPNKTDDLGHKSICKAFLRFRESQDVIRMRPEVPIVPPSRNAIDHFLGTVHALLPNSEMSLLVDGWMSPRTSYAIHLTCAAINEKTSSNTCLEYIPPEIVQDLCTDEETSKFTEGFSAIVRMIGDLAKMEHPPTVRSVRKGISSILSSSTDFFLDTGGCIEHVLDAVFSLADAALQDCENKLSHKALESEIEACPSTSLDYNFPLARTMCAHFGGGILTRYGPFGIISLETPKMDLADISLLTEHDSFFDADENEDNFTVEAVLFSESIAHDKVLDNSMLTSESFIFNIGELELPPPTRIIPARSGLVKNNVNNQKIKENRPMKENMFPEESSFIDSTRKLFLSAKESLLQNIENIKFIEEIEKKKEVLEAMTSNCSLCSMGPIPGLDKSLDESKNSMNEFEDFLPWSKTGSPFKKRVHPSFSWSLDLAEETSVHLS
eukprot:scaffold8315_cov50-Attheya_sp.AAC.2